MTGENEGIIMSITNFSRVVSDNKRKYSEAEKECHAVLYVVTNFCPYLYGRDFVLASDFELVYWITYIENTEARLI